MTKQYSVVGVDSVYYALVTQDDENNYVAGTPQQLSQAMEIKGTPAAASETQFADNMEHDIVTVEGPTTLEMIVPNVAEEVLAELLGSVYDSASGRIFDDANPTEAPYFALGYRFKKRNGSYRYRWYLKCRAEKPMEEGVSESDKVNLKTTTLKVTAVKTAYQFDLIGDGSRMSGVKRVHGDEDLANFDGATWFDAVQTPVAGTPDAFSVTPVPADGATGVVVSSNMTLTFTNALAGGREAGITLINLDTQAPVAVARTINAARTVVTLNPDSNLSASTDYAIIVHDVVDIHGQALTDAVYNFTTA
jgi:phi13 family phage major tail protein